MSYKYFFEVIDFNQPLTAVNCELNYKRLTDFRKANLLSKADYPKGSIEVHHIVPISCGGEDADSNLVRLFAAEHLLAHIYLWKIHENDEFAQPMLFALQRMVNSKKFDDWTVYKWFKASIEYQKFRQKFSSAVSEMSSMNIGSKNGNYGKHWYKDPNSNRCGSFMQDEQPDGWVRGRYVQNKPSTKGYIWVRRVNETKMVPKHIAAKLVETGEWEYGHYQKPISEQGRLNINHAHRPLLLLKHDAWLEETQKMADCYVQFGYEETCKKFGVKMSRESMLMRFIRARKKYGLKFESVKIRQGIHKNG